MKAVGRAQFGFQSASRLLVLGLVIRECFSFWTGHPTDFELWVRLGYAVAHGGDPYGMLPWVPGLSFANVFGSSNAATIAYLPFWPLLTGMLYLIYAAVGWDNRFFYYFLLKQPVILADVALAYLMFSFVYSRKPANAFWVLSFWLFSPFTIVISGLWGIFDSVAIFLLFLSITSNSLTKRVLWEALAIFAKSIPIIYAAPLTMKRLRDVWYASISIILAVLLSLVTFLAMHWQLSLASATIGSTAIKGGWSMSAWDAFAYMNYLGYLPSLSAPVYQALGILWIPALILFTLIAVKQFGKEGEYGMFQSLLVCTLTFLIFKARITEQYALYLFAISAIDVALWNQTRKSTLLATVAVGVIYLVINNYLLIHFLSPVYPGFANFENAASTTFGPIRLAGTFLAGTLFTCLNVKYLLDVLRKR